MEKIPTNTKASRFRYDCLLLEELYIQDNRLEEVPAAIFQLPSLITLDVSNNKLQKLPYDMWNATKLRDLNVAFNLLKDLPYYSTVSVSLYLKYLKILFKRFIFLETTYFKYV